MNILHLRSSEFFGGPERAIIGQCNHLKSITITCASFVRPGHGSDFLDRCAEAGVKVATIEESFAGDFRVTKKVIGVIRDSAIDLLITHDYKANLVGFFAARKTGTRHVAHFRGHTREDFKVRFYNALDNIMLRRIGHILVVSERSRELICKLGIKPERVTVVPNGFDISRATEKVNRTTTASSPVKIVAAGRLSFEKGYDILVNAISYLDRDLPEYCFYIYGEGPERNNLCNQINRLGIADQIQFCGYVDDLLPIFRDMDFMVLPSRSEGMPNVVLEAWSQRLGVLATAVGGLPEMITDGRNGFLAKPLDPQHLADKLTEAVRHRSRMHEFGEIGLETLKERYSFTRQAKLLTQIYETILDGQRD